MKSEVYSVGKEESLVDFKQQYQMCKKYDLGNSLEKRAEVGKGIGKKTI